MIEENIKSLIIKEDPNLPNRTIRFSWELYDKVTRNLDNYIIHNELCTNVLKLNDINNINYWVENSPMDLNKCIVSTDIASYLGIDVTGDTVLLVKLN